MYRNKLPAVTKYLFTKTSILVRWCRILLYTRVHLKQKKNVLLFLHLWCTFIVVVWHIHCSYVYIYVDIFFCHCSARFWNCGAHFCSLWCLHKQSCAVKVKRLLSNFTKHIDKPQVISLIKLKWCSCGNIV